MELRLLGMMKGLWVTVVILTSVPLRVVCPNAMGSRRRRNISRGIILKSENELVRYDSLSITGDILLQNQMQNTLESDILSVGVYIDTP